MLNFVYTQKAQNCLIVIRLFVFQFKTKRPAIVAQCACVCSVGGLCDAGDRRILEDGHRSLLHRPSDSDDTVSPRYGYADKQVLSTAPSEFRLQYHHR